MKVIRTIIFAALFLAIGALAVAPASAWYLPVFGFGPLNGPFVGPYGPATISPGTPEWVAPCIGRAQLVLPGQAFGIDAFHNSVGVGFLPGFDGPNFAAPGGINFGNKTATGKLLRIPERLI